MTFSHEGEIWSSVSASTVSMPPPQITVSGELSRALMVSLDGPALEHVGALAAGDRAGPADGLEVIGAAVAGDRDHAVTRAAAWTFSTSAPIRSFSPGCAVVGEAVERDTTGDARLP